MIITFYVIFSYVVGNFMTAYFIAKRFGKIDIRKHGSGHVGARNVGRILGKGAFLMTFFGDALKGALIILTGKWLGLAPVWLFLGFLAVLIGHIWPIALKFKGGKGIAAFIGALLVFNPTLFLLFACTFLLFFLILRSLTLAGMIAILLSTLFIYLYHYSYLCLIIYIFIAGLLVGVQFNNIKARIKKS